MRAGDGSADTAGGGRTGGGGWCLLGVIASSRSSSDALSEIHQIFAPRTGEANHDRRMGQHRVPACTEGLAYSKTTFTASRTAAASPNNNAWMSQTLTLIHAREHGALRAIGRRAEERGGLAASPGRRACPCPAPRPSLRPSQTRPAAPWTAQRRGRRCRRTSSRTRRCGRRCGCALRPWASALTTARRRSRSYHE